MDNAPLATASSTDDDKTNDYILIGLFAVIVGILVVLGMRSDFYGKKHQADQPYKYALTVDEDTVWDVEWAEPEPDAKLQLTSMGLRASF